MTDGPLSIRRFLVQFTDTAGGFWKDDKDFIHESSARDRMDHLVDLENKASARVVEEKHYRSRQTLN